MNGKDQEKITEEKVKDEKELLQKSEGASQGAANASTQTAPKDKKFGGKPQFSKGFKKGPKKDRVIDDSGPKLYNALIELRRVSKTTTGGKTLSFSAFMAVGDKDGKVGLAMGKSLTARDAIKKALKRASGNMQSVKMWSETIPHRCDAKYKAAKVLLMPASKGTGIVAGGAIRAVADVAGIKNLRAKSLGSSNKPAVALATVKSLSTLRTKKEHEQMLSY
jgi:small subunit ribosomal protein S5